MRLIPGTPALEPKLIRRPASNLSHISGSVAALATPFRDGCVNGTALAALCERQIRRGTAAPVVRGSTGEAAALSPVEQSRVIALAVEAAADRVPVIAGSNAPATEAATVLAVAAAPYSRPTQEGTGWRLASRSHFGQGRGRRPAATDPGDLGPWCA